MIDATLAGCPQCGAALAEAETVCKSCGFIRPANATLSNEVVSPPQPGPAPAEQLVNAVVSASPVVQPTSNSESANASLRDLTEEGVRGAEAIINDAQNLFFIFYSFF